MTTTTSARGRAEEFCETYGLQIPVLMAPMAGACPPALAAAVANENVRILEEEGIVENVRKTIAPYLKDKWLTLADHPMVGEAKVVGLMGSVALTPNKDTRAPFNGEAGKVGLICREHCFEANLIMRAVGDRMVISPPLIISEEEIDLLLERASIALDKTFAYVKLHGLM